MEIVYLKRLLDYPKLANWQNKGMTIKEIENLESKYNNGNPFPKAYREFLFIAGEMTYLETATDEFDWMQEKAREELQECGKTIDRPFFVIDQLDACTIFGFIYLDENVDDPIVYNCHAHESYWSDIEFVKKSTHNPFSKFIDACLDSAIIKDKYMTKK